MAPSSPEDPVRPHHQSDSTDWIAATMFRYLFAILMATFTGVALPAQTETSSDTPALTIADVSRMAQAGEISQALAAVKQALLARARDPQWRFLHGQLLVASQQPDEAMAVFTSLTEDFPDLPEPYNNLAVLQAAKGQTLQARSSLEAAVRADPSYGTAQENLGEVHVRMAIDAYQRAMALGGNKSILMPKLMQLQTLISPEKSPAPPRGITTKLP